MSFVHLHLHTEYSLLDGAIRIDEVVKKAKEYMANMSSEQIRTLIRIGGLRSTWYDSDSEWNASELSGYDLRGLCLLILSY